jgi:hypothetical protein
MNTPTRDDAKGAFPRGTIPSIDALPDELLAGVVSCLTCVERTRLSMVSRRWHAIASDDAAVGRVNCVVRRALNFGGRYIGLGDERRRLSACDLAAAEGHLRCLKGGGWRDRLTCMAALERGRTSVLEWLMPRCVRGRARSWSRSIAEAARRGHIEALRFLFARCRALVDTEAEIRALLSAACGDRVDVIDFLVSVGVVVPHHVVLETARCDSIGVLSYLRSRGCPWDDEVCRSAVGGGAVRCLAYAHRSGLSLAECEWPDVARSGRVETLHYALEHAAADVPVAKCMIAAIEGGRFDSMVLLRDRGGHAWDADLALRIAKAGRLNLLHRARLDGCPWDERVCEAASAGIRLDVLVYAHASGCPWDRRRCRTAASRHRRETHERRRKMFLDFLDEHRDCASGACALVAGIDRTRAGSLVVSGTRIALPWAVSFRAPPSA